MSVTSIQDKLANDIILFGKICFPNMFSSASPDFHHEIAELLIDRSNNKLNIIAPRGHANHR